MPTGTVLLVAVAVAGLWYAGTKTVDGVKKVNHKVASKFHHKSKTDPAQR